MSSLPIAVCSACGGTGWTRASRDGVDGVVRCDCSKLARTDRLLQRANIPLRYTHCELENFEIKASLDRSIEKAKLAAEIFIAEYPMAHPFGLLFMGPQGVGKTHLAVATIKQLMKLKSIPCLFRPFPDLLKEIQTSYDLVSRRSEYSLLQPVLETEVLVLDELGTVNPSDWVRDELAYVLNYRYNNSKVTILTTNYLDEGEKTDRKIAVAETLVADREYERKERNVGIFDTLTERIGNRMRSRLFEMCKTVVMNGPDYRMTEKNAHHI